MHVLQSTLSLSAGRADNFEVVFFHLVQEVFQGLTAVVAERLVNIVSHKASTLLRSKPACSTPGIVQNVESPYNIASDACWGLHLGPILPDQVQLL